MCHEAGTEITGTEAAGVGILTLAAAVGVAAAGAAFGSKTRITPND